MNKNKLFLLLLTLLVSSMESKAVVAYQHSLDSLVEVDFFGSKIVELCEEYVRFSKFFKYGSIHAAFRKNTKPVNGKFEINCSTFSLLISKGIPFGGSKYWGGVNKGSFAGDYLDSLIVWFSDGGPDDRNIKYSRDIAKKLFEDGYGKIPDKDFSDLETGDILFFNLDSLNDRPHIDFMGVDHSSIFGYRFGDRYLIYEVGDDNGPKKVLKTAETMKKVVLVGRLPRQKIYSNDKQICSNHDSKKLDVTGDGRTNYRIAELRFKTPLLKGHCYTLFVDAQLGTGIWINATYNGTSSYAFNMTNVREFRAIDGVYQIHFTAPEDINKLDLNVRSNDVIKIQADYDSCVLYEGLVKGLK